VSTLEELYYKMLRIRLIEERIASEYPKQEQRLPVHLSIGQEAVAVAVCEFLRAEDQMVSTHRGHAHYLAKGGNLDRFIAELYGKATGCGGGFAGSMHLTDMDCNFVCSTSIVGGTIPIGVGLAFAKKIKKEKGIVAICIGDAAIEEGVAFESFNFCALHGLPVVFVLENNLYSCFTHLSQRQPERPFKRVAYAYNMIHRRFFGQDIHSMINEMSWIFEEVRHGKPAFLEFDTYRYLTHCGPENDDHLGYRGKEEIEFWEKHDPIELAKTHLDRLNLWQDDQVTTLEAITLEIDDAFKRAKAAEFPVWKE